MQTDPAQPPDTETALVAACFEQIAAHGWARLSIPAAAHSAGIPLDVARRSLGDRCALLLRFGALADAFALKGALTEGPARDRLFDLVMRRIDFLQMHRAGVIALLRGVPFDPPAALLLTGASLRSMDWLLAAAGVDAAGPLDGRLGGTLRAGGLLAVWGWTVRAWQNDTNPDMAATMAALDSALTRAERAAGWLAPRGRLDSAAPMTPEDVPFTPQE